MSSTEEEICNICYLSVENSEKSDLKCHIIDNECLKEYINFCEVIPITCPVCDVIIPDYIIKDVLNDKDDLEGYYNRVNNQIVKHLDNGFKCGGDNCNFVGDVMPGPLLLLKCPSCSQENCLRCGFGVVHKGLNCKQYQESIKNQKNYENENIIICPARSCGAYINKVHGCGNVACPACKVEVCWYNKSLRWGPKGRGDLSGGCKCGVDGEKCHIECDIGCIPDPFTWDHVVHNDFTDPDKEFSSSDYDFDLSD